MRGEGPVPPIKPKESGSRGSCEKDIVSEKLNVSPPERGGAVPAFLREVG